MAGKFYDGGSAFPIEGGPNSGLNPEAGMTLLDYYAGKAMTVIVEECERSIAHSTDGLPEEVQESVRLEMMKHVAIDSFNYAEAMIFERNKRYGR